MLENKKVYMILTNGFDPDVRVYKEAKFLVKQGFNVTILCWDRKCEYKEKEEMVIDGIYIKRFLIYSIPGSGLKQIIPYIKFISKTKKYLKDKEFNFLHCHDFDGMLAGMFIGKKNKCNVVIDMHELYTKEYSYGRLPFFKYLLKKAINYAKYIIYVNDEQIKNIKTKEMIYLPNYPEKEIYEPIIKNTNKKIRINYIGSVRDAVALQTLGDIQDDNLQIGIYGTGIEYEKIKEKYAQTSTKIYGKFNGIDDIGNIYRNTDILYCSYNPNNENWKNAFPVKFYEAIITHTPIIVSEGTAIAKFVKEHKIGETIEYGNMLSVKKAIETITKKYDDYKKNLLEISDKYTWNDIQKNLLQIYKK